MLSNSDKSFIETNRLMDIKSLAAETGRPLKDIKAYVETLPPLTDNEEKKKEVASEGLPIDKKSRVHKQMSSPETPGVTIMTPGASKAGDEDAKVKNKTRGDNSHIYRVR